MLTCVHSWRAHAIIYIEISKLWIYKKPLQISPTVVSEENHWITASDITTGFPTESVIQINLRDFEQGIVALISEWMHHEHRQETKAGRQGQTTSSGVSSIHISCGFTRLWHSYCASAVGRVFHDHISRTKCISASECSCHRKCWLVNTSSFRESYDWDGKSIRRCNVNLSFTPLLSLHLSPSLTAV